MQSFLQLLLKLFVLFPGVSFSEFKQMFNFKLWGKSNISKLSPYEQNRLYFCSASGKINLVSAIFYIILAIVIMSATSFHGAAVAIGVIVILVIIFFIVASTMSTPKISKNDIMNNIQTRVAELKQEGLDANGIDESQVNIAGDPLCISEFLFYDLIYKHYERDGMSSNIGVTYFYAGIDQFYIFKSKLSVVNASEQNTETNDYFYRDIVNSNVKTDASKPGIYIFEMSLVNGQRISYEFSDSNDVNQKLLAIKNLIRDKRNNY